MMLNERQRVRKAIRFEKPDRVPMLHFNFDKEDSDIVLVDIQQHFGGADGLQSEWGFVWERVDGTMGQVREPLLKTERDAAALRAPALRAGERMAAAKREMAQYGPDKYFLASMQLSGFTTMSILRGFAQTLEDLVCAPELAQAVADAVFGFETELIDLAARCGFDGVAFYDDWGTQNGLFLSPQMWTELFLPRYKAQFNRVHAHGMDVYFHSCGQITPIIGGLFDAGVDMLNLSQPNLYDMEALGREYGGRRCFVIPVSYQTTLLTGGREEIYADVARAVRCLGAAGGGLIGYAEDYSSLHMPAENLDYNVSAFRELGRYGEEGVL